MKICVVGCGHGLLNIIYETAQLYETKNNFKIDLMIICGDVQTLRNVADYDYLSVPPKYRTLGDFHEYYSGKKKAPILTLMVGGNHEASAYLQELAYGGWVAPNIYYMGLAGVVQFGGLRIGGLSGIYKPGDYNKGYYEGRLPPNVSMVKSVYHVRRLAVLQLLQNKQPIDIMISHDWPIGITKHGDEVGLLKKKAHFTQDVTKNVLGSKPASEILYHLKPRYWFSAHLHCKFTAVCKHNDSDKITRFLALDKIGFRRQWIQFLDIEPDPNSCLRYASSSPKLSLDLEWMGILKCTSGLRSYRPNDVLTPMPLDEKKQPLHAPTKEQLEEIAADFEHNFAIPENFAPIAPTSSDPAAPLQRHLNPQTELLQQMLDLCRPYFYDVPDMPPVNVPKRGNEDECEDVAAAAPSPATGDWNEIDLESDDDNDDEADAE